MNAYAALGALVLVTGGLGSLVWFANRAGKNAVSVSTSEAAKSSADAQTRKAQAMAQAQADKPATEESVLQRLGDGSA